MQSADLTEEATMHTDQSTTVQFHTPQNKLNLIWEKIYYFAICQNWLVQLCIINSFPATDEIFDFSGCQPSLLYYGGHCDLSRAMVQQGWVQKQAQKGLFEGIKRWVKFVKNAGAGKKGGARLSKLNFIFRLSPLRPLMN